MLAIRRGGRNRGEVTDFRRFGAINAFTVLERVYQREQKIRQQMKYSFAPFRKCLCDLNQETESRSISYCRSK